MYACCFNLTSPGKPSELNDRCNLDWVPSLNMGYNGVSRISARGVLKLRPDTKSGGGGGGGGGCCRFLARYEKRGGGGGGAVGFWPGTKSEGGGGGAVGFGPGTKSGGGGGGGVWPNTSAYLECAGGGC